eukprot:m.9161 g.9161  ORF g.9161 m.9161 type:complete len:135 (-) comp9376_c0_seq3:67-471(-)
MGCPVIHSNAYPELTAALKAFDLLLPDCSVARLAAQACRESKAGATTLERFSWVLGLGESHCVAEAEAHAACLRRRDATSKRILSECGFDNHKALGQRYMRCLKATPDGPCASILSEFLACATTAAQQTPSTTA